MNNNNSGFKEGDYLKYKDGILIYKDTIENGKCKYYVKSTDTEITLPDRNFSSSCGYTNYYRLANNNEINIMNKRLEDSGYIWDKKIKALKLINK